MFISPALLKASSAANTFYFSKVESLLTVLEHVESLGIPVSYHTFDRILNRFKANPTFKGYLRLTYDKGSLVFLGWSSLVSEDPLAVAHRNDDMYTRGGKQVFHWNCDVIAAGLLKSKASTVTQSKPVLKPVKHKKPSGDTRRQFTYQMKRAVLNEFYALPMLANGRRKGTMALLQKYKIRNGQLYYWLNQDVAGHFGIERCVAWSRKPIGSLVTEVA